MVFRSKGRTFWKVRVQHPDGRSKRCGCDTDDKATAKAMEAWVRQVRKERDLTVLDAIVSGRVTLPRAFDRRHDLAALLAEADDVNLEPHVQPWHDSKAKSRKGAASAGKYLTHLRLLIPAKKVFSRSRFTSKEIRAHLRALKVEDPTRNRHKAAISSFASYLVDEGLLERNVVRDVRGWPEGEGRIVYYERDQAKLLISSLPQPYAAAEAFMVGAGLEWQAVARLRAADVDLEQAQVFARGGKSSWRMRLCRIVEAWTLEHIRPALAGKIGATLVFDGMQEWDALRMHKSAAVIADLPRSTLHDWRHTHAVLMLRAGYKPMVVAHQLGHRDTTLVWKRYGRFVVDERDYQLEKSPQEAPAPRKRMRRGGVK